MRGGRNGLMFRLMISRGVARYRKLGTIAMEVTGVEVSCIDDLHAMARVGWLALYKSGREIACTNVYLLQIRDGEPKVFAWITPDEEKALREAGLTG